MILQTILGAEFFNVLGKLAETSKLIRAVTTKLGSLTSKIINEIKLIEE
jgi:hypothetical protein